MRDYTRLFSPLSVGPLTLRNRIVMPPMVANMQVGSDQAHAWYVARARGGVGLIIREATAIRQLADPVFTGKLKRTVDAVHRAGAAMAVQLVEWGRAGSSETIAASATDNAREATEGVAGTDRPLCQGSQGMPACGIRWCRATRSSWLFS